MKRVRRFFNLKDLGKGKEKDTAARTAGWVFSWAAFRGDLWGFVSDFLVSLFGFLYVMFSFLFIFNRACLFEDSLGSSYGP